MWQEMMGVGGLGVVRIALAFAAPYANNLHLADNHTNTLSLNFLQVGCSSGAICKQSAPRR